MARALTLSGRVAIDAAELEWQAVRAAGPGGQHVNKVATALRLRFDSQASSLPAVYKQRILEHRDRRIGADGVIVIKAQRFRSQEQNRRDAGERLVALIREATRERKKRRPTRMPKAARRRRADAKTRRGRLKRQRSRPGRDD